jgi:hypothetical protein
MTNIYLNPKPRKKVEIAEPSQECISFLLNYSKSLRIVKYKDLEFESIQN